MKMHTALLLLIIVSTGAIANILSNLEAISSGTNSIVSSPREKLILDIIKARRYDSIVLVTSSTEDIAEK